MKISRTDLSLPEKLTFALLFVGYVFYYLTRKNITVASISMKELGLLTTAQIAYISSLGTLFYAAGKFVNGFMADRIGGKRSFLLGMFGSVGATSLFGLSSDYPMFLLTWALNSYFLSMGWSGLIKVMSLWFGREGRGTMMGWMCLNFQLGSSVAKAFTSFLLCFPLLVWRGLFFVPALLLFLMALVILFLLQEKPGNEKMTPCKREEAGAGPPGRRDVAGVENAPPRMWLRLLKSPMFLLVLWASAAITLIRTFFDDFTAIWLNESGLPADVSGYISSLFTVGGMIGTVLMGTLSDRVGKGNRGPFMIVSGLLLGILLFLSGFFPKDSVFFSVIFFTLAGVFVYGIYSILGGVTAIDFGGSAAPSTAAGIIDGIGYLAAALAGVLVAQMKQVAQWESLVFWFAVLTMIVALSLLPLWRRYPKHGLSAETSGDRATARQGGDTD
jgi:sugar phosphate permease